MQNAVAIKGGFGNGLEIPNRSAAKGGDKMNVYEGVVNAIIDNTEEELYEVLKSELIQEVKKESINFLKVKELTEVLEKLEVLI